MQQPWRFLNTGRGDAARNMAIDEAVLLIHETGGTPPTLRVYGWNVPTLSLGYAQKVSQDIDQVACQQHGVAIVRRPTGGRAVLHDQEVTYSVVLPTALNAERSTLMAHYRLIGTALMTALQHLGVPAQLERSHRRTQPRHEQMASACFATLARYELSVMGKKMAGSAQKRLQRALLQHGSIPLWLDRRRLLQCLRVPPEQLDDLVQAAYTTMITVNELSATRISTPILHNALREGFAASFRVDLVEASLFPEEERLAQELWETKYTTPLWNLEGAAAWRQQNQPRPPI